jgi:hypothetical protein
VLKTLISNLKRTKKAKEEGKERVPTVKENWQISGKKKKAKKEGEKKVKERFSTPSFGQKHPGRSNKIVEPTCPLIWRVCSGQRP